MANTYTLIQSATVGSGGASSIDFTSIPATYTDIKIALSLRTTETGARSDFYWTINGDTSAVYSILRVFGYDGNNTASGKNLNAIPANAAGLATSGNTATSNTFGSIEMYMPNYTASVAKSNSIEWTAENNSSTNFILGLNANLWNSTSAITSISFYVNSGNWVQYSSAYLYGISNS
jgi:hypothetical protein